MSTALFRSVDRAAFVVSLGVRLRTAGVPVTATALGSFTEALACSPPSDLRTLYWLARVTLVHQPHHLSVFDAVFDAVFADAVLPVDPAARRAQQRREDDAYAAVDSDSAQEEAGEGLPWHTLPQVVDTDDGSAADGRYVPELMPSAVERISEIDFEDLDEQQLELLGRWLERSLHLWPMRQSRRQKVYRTGRRVALRETIARSRRTGWEPIELGRYRPVQRHRPVVLLADVSQSMQAYTRAYLHLMRAFARTGRAETFAFSTSLTRLTPALAHRSPQVALALASEQVVDRYGGTHLATCLRDLLTSRQGNTLRGAVLVVASDGWDSDDPAELADAMTRVRRRAHRVVWLNPRAAAPDYAPLVGPMAAALPFCDTFLPANTVSAMPAVLEAIEALSSRG